MFTCFCWPSQNWPFFPQISGRNFLPELWRGVYPKTAPLQALRCALCSTEQSTFQGGERGEKVPRKGAKRGGRQRGRKGKKDAWKQVRKTIRMQACDSNILFWEHACNNLCLEEINWWYTAIQVKREREGIDRREFSFGLELLGFRSSLFTNDSYYEGSSWGLYLFSCGDCWRIDGLGYEIGK